MTSRVCRWIAAVSRGIVLALPQASAATVAISPLTRLQAIWSAATPTQNGTSLCTTGRRGRPSACRWIAAVSRGVVIAITPALAAMVVMSPLNRMPPIWPAATPTVQTTTSLYTTGRRGRPSACRWIAAVSRGIIRAFAPASAATVAMSPFTRMPAIWSAATPTVRTTSLCTTGRRGRPSACRWIAAVSRGMVERLFQHQRRRSLCRLSVGCQQFGQRRHQ